jgi:PAS domain S-box-containing protein
MRRESSPVDLRRTLQHVRVPSYMLDRQGVVTWANDAAKAAFGPVEGKLFGGIVAPADLEFVRRQFERKLAGSPATDYAIDVRTRAGVWRRAEVSSVPIEDGDRHCCAVFGIVLAGRAQRTPRRHAKLTPRQSDVLTRLGEGLSTDQIAAELHVSRETVRNHVRGVLRALGVHSRVEAVAVARQEGLLDD